MPNPPIKSPGQDQDAPSDEPNKIQNKQEHDAKVAPLDERETAQDEELKKTEKNPESNLDYVEQQLRERDA